MVCYNSEYADLFINGIEKIMDTYNIDGVYLDGTSMPNYCTNVNHGCGWYDGEGRLHEMGIETYLATRAIKP